MHILIAIINWSMSNLFSWSITRIWTIFTFKIGILGNMKLHHLLTWGTFSSLESFTRAFHSLTRILAQIEYLNKTVSSKEWQRINWNFRRISKKAQFAWLYWTRRVKFYCRRGPSICASSRMLGCCPVVISNWANQWRNQLLERCLKRLALRFKRTTLFLPSFFSKAFQCGPTKQHRLLQATWSFSTKFNCRRHPRKSSSSFKKKRWIQSAGSTEKTSKRFLNTRVEKSTV